MSELDSSVPEGFKQIPNYPRYAISKTGEILSICGRGVGQMRPWSDAVPAKPWLIKGYLGVGIRNHQGRRKVCVHTLVLETYVGPRPEGMECRHLDGNTANCDLNNLAWGTQDENVCDRIRHGRLPKGELHHKAKLTALQVVQIRKRRMNGESLGKLGKEFSITKTYVQRIASRLSWKHVD